MNTVTRLEIADSLDDAFTSGTASCTDLVEYAAEHGARPPVVQVLSRLHHREYRELRDLWPELSDVPIEQ